MSPIRDHPYTTLCNLVKPQLLRCVATLNPKPPRLSLRGQHVPRGRRQLAAGGGRPRAQQAFGSKRGLRRLLKKDLLKAFEFSYMYIYTYVYIYIHRIVYYKVLYGVLML